MGPAQKEHVLRHSYRSPSRPEAPQRPDDRPKRRGGFCLHPALRPTVYEIVIWHTFWLDGSKDARNDCIRYICGEYHIGKEQMTISFLQVVGDLALLLVPCLVMLVWVLKRDR
jgi:hypothetical protein